MTNLQNDIDNLKAAIEKLQEYGPSNTAPEIISYIEELAGHVQLLVEVKDQPKNFYIVHVQTGEETERCIVHAKNKLHARYIVMTSGEEGVTYINSLIEEVEDCGYENVKELLEQDLNASSLEDLKHIELGSYEII